MEAFMSLAMVAGRLLAEESDQTGVWISYCQELRFNLSLYIWIAFLYDIEEYAEINLHYKVVVLPSYTFRAGKNLQVLFIKMAIISIYD